MFERGVRALRSLGWQRAMHSDRQTKRKTNTPNEGSIQGQFQSHLPESNGAKSNEKAGFIGIRTERTENQIAGLTRSSECVRKLLDHYCPRVAVNELCAE